MEKKTFKLWENGAPYYDKSISQEEPSLTWYPAENTDEIKGCIIVLPGGGYAMRADYEGGDISMMLSRNGYHSFVLNYRVTPYHHPAEISDALRAIRFVRYNAKSFGIKKDKIAILGFSAGGHLAVSAAEHFDYGLSTGDEIDRESSRPDGVVLCYAVSTLLGKYTHVPSRINLLGYEEEDDIAYKLSGPENVRDDMPPVFIWHTFEDTCVPVENALMMTSALKKKNIPTELHIFPTGEHGLGLSDANPHTAQWISLLCKWLEFYKF